MSSLASQVVSLKQDYPANKEPHQGVRNYQPYLLSSPVLPLEWSGCALIYISGLCTSWSEPGDADSSEEARKHTGLLQAASM